ncbi:PIN2/TERF1-interacting telomerase inhibitor 1 isoform X1 [Sciurus carolinensis]|uniref:PIN2/TERF1-interacting telomerase inhibitor 1 isoform X1 n=1 Tax=Sciurus carolinensis TaxID=30640 RepID=UPI001FB413BC|nr:PIN2/TERF1-interacting telomerase inhibitor 1 isoform X1 [Sciurus carolinensis]
MSMLAERRRKQKWAVDPRNTAWSNDDSKFGQRMLEKMGWSKGKGLGAQEQGATDHIKVQVKNNHLGLGATINNEDNWIAHQDDFNQLLAELNTCHGQETADSSDNKEKKSFHLEEKSKISKNRVHYMKFTKGKDLSSRSSTDLDCIFGKRQSKKTAEQDGRSPCTPDGSEASMTTTSAVTIQEYFAQRMAQLQSRPRLPASQPSLPETRVEWKSGKKKEKEVADNPEEGSHPKAKRSKKGKSEEESQGCVAKKRVPVEGQPRGPCGDECSKVPAEAAEGCVQPPDDQGGAPKPRKRRAKDRPQKPAEVALDATLDNEAPVARRRQKKKKRRKEEEKVASR